MARRRDGDRVVWDRRRHLVRGRIDPRPFHSFVARTPVQTERVGDGCSCIGGGDRVRPVSRLAVIGLKFTDIRNIKCSETSRLCGYLPNEIEEQESCAK